IHYHTLRKMWSKYEGICPITYITNAQNFKYWHNAYLYEALEKDDTEALQIIKLRSKKDLFDIVADQGGEIYNEKICTIVFAKRFAGYKRADLLLSDMERFHNLVSNKERPVQIIWA